MKIKSLMLAVICSFAMFCPALSQFSQPEEKKFSIGFNFALPTGLAPATALTNGMESIQKSYAFGIIIQRKIAKNFNLFFDINLNDYNNKIGDKGEDVQSVWTVEESATHWDEPGAPQIQYVHNLPTDVHFDMQTTGMRLGGKYYFSDKSIKPWAGLAIGYYAWTVNYYNEDKKQTYGSDEGSLPGLTYLFGIDFRIVDDVFLSAFADLASPVAKYNIEGLFYPQWDITDYQAHIMGPYRFGLTLSFAAGK